MGELQTGFGRHYEALEDLAALLQESKLPQHNALVVGAGLDQLNVFRLLSDNIKAKQPLWLQKKYSWEYLEVAAVLERLGKPWTLTVVDASPEVCEAVQRQEEVVIESGYDGLQYAKMFLAALGTNACVKEELRVANSALESSRILYSLAVCSNIYIPSAIRERIEIINGSAQNLDDLALPHERYDAIIALNVFLHIHDPAGRIRAEDALSRRIEERGIIVTDVEFCRLPQIRAPIVREYPDYGLEGELAICRYVTYFMGKPQPLSLQVPLRV